MHTIRCDGCGKELKRGGLRYVAHIDVKAAYDQLEVGLVDLVRDFRAEMETLIARMKDKTPAEIEESVYKHLDLDLCATCQKAFIRNPLRFHPEQGVEEAPINIDAFLRSLGFGGDAGGDPT